MRALAAAPVIIVIIAAFAVLAEAQTDFTRITNIRTYWGLASVWPGSCPGECNDSVNPWVGLYWSGSTLQRFELFRSDNVVITNSSWPDELWEFPGLNALQIEHQNMSCPPWAKVMGNTQWYTLSLKDCFPSAGCISPNYAGLTAPHWISIAQNFLSGPWPDALNAYSTLEGVYIDGNTFSLPSTMDLSLSGATLRDLWMDRWVAAELNPYQPWMSTATINLKELGTGGLWNGTFVCPISSTLKILNIPFNNFSTPPQAFPTCNFASSGICALTDYNVEYSRFTGTFPTELLRCASLETIYMGGNDFQGTGLPSNVELWINMTEIDIESASGFNTTLPITLGQLKKLQTIDMNESPGVYGPLPTELGLATALRTLDLDNTRINGTLPQEFAFLTQLKQLDLSNTLISGDTPGWMMHMPAAADINLSSTLITNCSRPNVQTFKVNAGTTFVRGFNITTDKTLSLCDPCPLPRPLNGTVCFNDQWYYPGGYIVPPSTPLNVSSPIVVIGNFSVPSTASVEIAYNGNSTTPLIQVKNGTATITGELEIRLVQTPSSGQLTVINATSLEGNFTTVTISQTSGNGCQYSITQANSGSSLTVLFSAPPSCSPATNAGPGPSPSSYSHKRTIIMAATIAGGIVLIAVLVTTIVVIVKKGYCKCLMHADDDEKVLTV